MVDALDIWVIGELRGREPSPWTLELVTGARALAEGGGGRVAVVTPTVASTDSLAAHGAGLVVTVGPAGAHPPVEAVVAAARAALAGSASALVLAPDTLSGRDAAAQLAAALDAPLVTSCERVSLEAGAVRIVRSCFGGHLSADVRVDAPRAVLTVQEHIFRARPRAGRGSCIVRAADAPAEPRVALLERRMPAPGDVDLGEAEVLVGGGLGVGRQGFARLDRLAALMGGATAASRAAVDEGWVPRSKQVGQTGRRVAPKLYFACGISGALQHMVGVRDAGVIVALNSDERAPIMREADLAAVGDAGEVLPLLLRELGDGEGAR